MNNPADNEEINPDDLKNEAISYCLQIIREKPSDYRYVPFHNPFSTSVVAILQDWSAKLFKDLCVLPIRLLKLILVSYFK